MKKLSFTLILGLLSSIAFAKQPSPEMSKVVHVLLANQEISQSLTEQGTISLTDYEIKKGAPGHNLYKLIFSRKGMVAPLKAEVKIEEDLTPTYVDGPAKYSTSIEFID